MSHAGRFVWRELIAPNPGTTAGFYQSLFGWSANPVDMGMPEPYTLLHHDELDEDVGGAMAPPMEGVPAHWLDYVTVDDVDAALAKAVELGGTAITDVMEIPVGRFAIVKDPAGATLALFTSATPGASDTERQPPVGTFCWSQLMTDALEEVVPFYTGVFGWAAVRNDDGSVWFMDGETPRASAMPKPAEAQAPNHWLQYVAVDDADAAFAEAKALGAQAFMGPMDMPGMGRFAVLADPAGAPFAIWKDAQQ